MFCIMGMYCLLRVGQERRLMVYFINIKFWSGIFILRVNQRENLLCIIVQKGEGGFLE